MECSRVNATRAKRELEDRSPGSPSAPMPRLYACCNLNRGIYYYTTYENHRISAVDMHKENLDAAGLIRYTPVTVEQIYRQN